VEVGHPCWGPRGRGLPVKEDDGDEKKILSLLSKLLSVHVYIGSRRECVYSRESKE
jgi:hypothetical protein